MNRQTAAVVVGALVLFAVAVVGAMAFTGTSGTGGDVHTMPDGSTMTGPMDTDGVHTMGDGSTMSNEEMP